MRRLGIRRLALVTLLLVSATGFAQQKLLRIAVTPQLGAGYKLSDWLYGTPLYVGFQGQLLYKNRYVLDVAAHLTSFQDVVFKNWEAKRLFSSEIVRHQFTVVQLGAGYDIRLRRKHDLIITAGGTYVNYKEPYVVGTGGMLFSGYRVDTHTRHSLGLYGKIQLNVELENQRSFLSFGTTMLSCRYVSYGAVYVGYTLRLPPET